MAKKKFIRSLQTNDANLIQILSSFVLGDNEIGIYNPNQIYNKTDVIYMNTGSNEIKIMRCIEDGITGTFNNIYWEIISLSDFLKDVKNNKFTSLGENKPTDPANVIWFEPFNKN